MEARSTAHTNVRADFRDKGWHLTIAANEETISGLEIARFQCPEPKKSEHDLLFKYFRYHLELPPANNKCEGELQEDEKAQLLLMCLAPKEREETLKKLGQGGASAPPKPEPETPGL